MSCLHIRVGWHDDNNNQGCKQHVLSHRDQATCTRITVYGSAEIIKSFFSDPLWIIRPWRAAKIRQPLFTPNLFRAGKTQSRQRTRAVMRHWEIREFVADIQSSRRLALQTLPPAERAELEIYNLTLWIQLQPERDHYSHAVSNT